MGITSVGNDLFPEIDKVMSNYLTPHILSAEYLEMAQCLYFIANKVEPDIVEVIAIYFWVFWVFRIENLTLSIFYYIGSGC